MLAAHYNGKIISFAAPLKAAMLALGIPRRNVHGTTAEKSQALDMLGGKSARQFAQLFGTEFGRKMIADDLWLKLFEYAIWAADTEYVFCDDLRFLNEAKAIRKLGGTIIRVSRPGYSPLRDAHASELEHLSIEVDHWVDNTGDEMALFQKALTALGRFE
jgi:hypothetical protein